MFLGGVVLTVLAVLLSLTTLTLRASGQLRHVSLVAVALVATLATGLAFLIE